MAPYFSNYAKDDERDGTGQGQANDTGTFQRGAAGAGSSDAAPSGAGTIADRPGAVEGASQQNAAKTGSQYQSLDSYLGANADSGFGNQVAARVAGQQVAGVADQHAASGRFNQQVQDSNRTPTQEQIEGAIANPNPTAADVSQYQGWENQTYKGPKSLSDSASLNQQYWGNTKKAVQQTGQLTGNDTGQYSLINSYFGGPTGSSAYSSNNGPTGQQGLDLALAQNTAGYGDTIAGLQRSGAQLQQQGLQGAQALQNNASVQAGNVANSATAAKGAVAGAINNLEGNINQGVTDANTANAASVSQLQNYLKGGGNINALTPEQLAGLGLTAGQNTYGADLSGSVLAAPAFTSANVETADQQSRLKALESLAGGSNPDAMATQSLISGASPYAYDASNTKNKIQSNLSTQNSNAYHQALNNSTISLPAMNLGGGFLGSGLGATQTQAGNISGKDLQTIVQAISQNQPITVGGAFGYWLNNQGPEQKQAFADQALKLLNQASVPLKQKYSQT